MRSYCSSALVIAGLAALALGGILGGGHLSGLDILEKNPVSFPSGFLATVLSF